MLVQNFLEQSTTRLPAKIGLICNGQRLTYADIDRMANRLGQAMIAQGLQRGDRVAIYLPNSVEAVISIFAVLKAGGVFVVINHTTKPDKLTYILNDCQAVGLVTDGPRHRQAQNLPDQIPSLAWQVLCGETAISQPGLLSFKAIQRAYPANRPRSVNIDLDLACLIYTSGSTGQPKGVMSDHSNMVFAAGSIIEYLQNVESDIIMNVLPLSFDYGLYQLLMTFKFGGTLVLEQSFAYPAAILNRLATERATGLPGVPTIFAILLKLDLSSYNLSSLRYVSNTGAALPPSHIEEIRRKFPGVTVYSMYGLTETKRTLYLPPDQLDRRPGSVGIAIPGTEVWLEDETGQRLGPNQTGELVVRGRHVMRGYWHNPTATAHRYRSGPLPGERVCHTGDLFRMDSDGYFYFVGRRDDIIKSRGEKVAPKEVETVLYALPGVVETAVIGVPDAILGQAIKAFVVCDGTPLTKAQVLAHCRAHLEDFMMPKYVEFQNTLPKTSSGKIKKINLK